MLSYSHSPPVKRRSNAGLRSRGIRVAVGRDVQSRSLIAEVQHDLVRREAVHDPLARQQIALLWGRRMKTTSASRSSMTCRRSLVWRSRFSASYRSSTARNSALARNSLNPRGGRRGGLCQPHALEADFVQLVEVKDLLEVRPGSIQDGKHQCHRVVTVRGPPARSRARPRQGSLPRHRASQASIYAKRTPPRARTEPVPRGVRAAPLYGRAAGPRRASRADDEASRPASRCGAEFSRPRIRGTGHSP